MAFGILYYSIGLKIRAHKRLFRVLATIVSRKFGNRPIIHKVRENTEIGVEERHPLRTLLAALWKISNWVFRHINLLLFLATHSTSVLFFVLVISTRVCDSGSSTFSDTFSLAHFVVKPTL